MDIERLLHTLLPRVQRPARYVGGELNQVVKRWDAVATRIALAFPDIYDLGMPNNGLAILYDQVNQQPDMLAERTYVPWTDMQALMRERGLPLFSLESKRPVRDFDVLGISLPYESLYTNVLTLLDLAGISLQTIDRGRDEPVVIGGGHATFNPEPMWAFFDAFVIGEGEEVLLEVARCVAAWSKGSAERSQLHRHLATIEGVYVPSLYTVSYNADGTVCRVDRTDRVGSPTVRKRIVAQLPPPLTRFIVPNVDTVHNRVAIEIMRGCTRGCRFCHAGMVTRPVRQRSVEEVVNALDVALRQTGYTDVGLLSLSSSDYVHVLPLVREVRDRFADRKLNISLPSLRIESFSVELMEALQGASRRGGFTLAPEAATERMREIINKPVSSSQVLQTAAEVYRRGWHTIKLYFMIGHPAEQLADVEAIGELALAVLAEGRKVIGGRAKVNVGVSTFVPKPHTPFQWVPCDTADQIKAKQALLRNRLRRRGIKLSWTNTQESLMEAWLSRGDRRMSQVIFRAWQLGARFDAWQEHFRFEQWQQAFAHAGLDPHFYTHRQRSPEEVFPWDHVDCGLHKRFLQQDYQWSLQGKTREDCRNRCFACGILPKYKELRRSNPGDVWECPDVGRAAVKAGLQAAKPTAEATQRPDNASKAVVPGPVPGGVNRAGVSIPSQRHDP